jgi:hypothetical protein
MMNSMNAKVISAAALGGGLAIMLGVAGFNRHSAREAKASLELLAKRSDFLNSGIRRAEDRIAGATRDSAEMQAALAAQPIAPRNNERTVPALMAADPKLYALGMKAFQAGLHWKFGPLFRTLNLTPDQIDKFESLESQHEEAQIDIMATASAQGMPFSDPIVAALMSQENGQYQAAQQALLGDTGYQQLQQFNRMAPVMGIVDTVAVSVALTPTPLTGAQSDRLAQILANASSQFQSGGPATPATINWPATLGQAQAILSPAQFAALEGVYDGNQIGQIKTQFYNQEETTP